MTRVLVVGASGQIGSELVDALAAVHGEANVFAADLAGKGRNDPRQFVPLDILDARRLREVVDHHRIDEVFQLAAVLSANGEAAPLPTWALNIDGLLNVLELARERRIARVFWPSSIAAFGPHSAPLDTPQYAVMDPTTIYGISKLAGERLCEYYYSRFGVDVRSLRYPGVISYKTPAGGGTTDYAMAMFEAARQGTDYRCFLAPDSRLPMIYMQDAVRAVLELMAADSARLRVRSSYNLAGLSFTPAELAAALRRYRPDFRVSYEPDFRQAIADSWPRSIDDTEAQHDWDWQHRIGFEALVADMWHAGKPASSHGSETE